MEEELNKMKLYGQPWVPLPIKHYAYIVKRSLQNYVEHYPKDKQRANALFFKYFHERLFN